MPNVQQSKGDGGPTKTKTKGRKRAMSNVKCQMSKVKYPMSKAAPVSVSHSGGSVQDLPRVQNMFRDDSGNGKGFLILVRNSLKSLFIVAVFGENIRRRV